MDTVTKEYAEHNRKIEKEEAEFEKARQQSIAAQKAWAKRKGRKL